MAKRIYFFLGILLTLYLLLSSPKLPPPDLPESLKSTEPGDTVQLKNISAYFTNEDRENVLNFYTDYFSRSPFLKIPLPTFRLNHPPEYAKEVIRDTIKSYYLEEIVHPFRESLFVNGFEWENDVFTPKESRKKNLILVDGEIWKSKITLRWFYSSIFLRILIFWLAWLLFRLIINSWKKEVLFFRKMIKKQKR